MRILGFSKKWAKLKNDTFTTFRYRRKDADKGRDWHNGETLKIIYHPRHEHEYLGIAKIINKEAKPIGSITILEAVEDGFNSDFEMREFLGNPELNATINKLTLKWAERAK